MFQTRFEKLDEFDWWYMEGIQTSSSTQFISKEFQEIISIFEVQL